MNLNCILRIDLVIKKNMDATKVEKKLKRKLLQVSQKFPNSDLAQTVSDSPTILVFIGNGGIDCGISSDLLYDLLLLTDLDHDNEITMIHSKLDLDFSIVEFTNAASAEMAMARLNGRCVQELVRERKLISLAPQHLMSGPPLHLLMAYLSRIPQVFLCEPTAIVVPSDAKQQSPLPPGCFLLRGFVTDDEEVALLEFFSTDFPKLMESLEHCIDWERSMCDRQRLDSENSDPYVSKHSKQTSFVTPKDSNGKTLLHTPKDPKGPSSLSPPEDPNWKTPLCTPGDSKGKTPIYTHLKLRTVHHYGYEFLYGSNTIDPTLPLPGGLPSIMDFVIERLMGTGLVAHPPDQLTVNEYQPGAGIPRHVDTHSAFKDGISLITLGSQTVMQFQDVDGRKVDVLLPRKSLLVMTGEARYAWTHSIPARKYDVISPLTAGVDCLGLRRKPLSHLIIDRYIRVSLTLRKVHCDPCQCDYPHMCDYRELKTDSR